MQPPSGWFLHRETLERDEISLDNVSDNGYYVNLAIRLGLLP